MHACVQQPDPNSWHAGAVTGCAATHRSGAHVTAVAGKQLGHVCEQAGCVLPCQLQHGGGNAVPIISFVCSKQKTLISGSAWWQP